jgi:hypothetical protein
MRTIDIREQRPGFYAWSTRRQVAGNRDFEGGQAGRTFGADGANQDDAPMWWTESKGHMAEVYEAGLDQADSDKSYGLVRSSPAVRKRGRNGT